MSQNHEILKRGFDALRSMQYRMTLDALHDLGEWIIKYAQEHFEEYNWTFNTRDSYGYAIFYNGQLLDGPTFGEQYAITGTESIEEGWPVMTDRRFGVVKSKEFIETYAAPSKGWCIVITTGTEYSEYLESVRHIDVLTNVRDEFNHPMVLDLVFAKL